VHGYREFVEYCKEDIINTLSEYSNVKDAIYSLLNGIKKDKIVVVESGCSF